MVGVEAEVRAAVLICDASRRADDAGPEPHVVRLDQADRVSGRVDDAEPGRAATAWDHRRRRSGGTGRVDPGRQLGSVRLVEEPLERRAMRLRVCEVGVPVGHRQLRRLDPEMGPAQIVAGLGRKCVRRRRLKSLEDVEDLEGNEPGAVRGVAGHLNPAIVDADRLCPGRAVSRQVVEPDGRAGSGERANLGGSRLSGIELVPAGLRDPGQRRRQRGQANALAGSPGSSARAVDRLPGEIRAELDIEPRRTRFDRLDEAVPGGEPADGQLDRRGEEVGARQPSEIDRERRPTT